MEKTEKSRAADKPCCTVKVITGDGASEACCAGDGGERVIKLDCGPAGSGCREIRVVCEPGPASEDSD